MAEQMKHGRFAWHDLMTTDVTAAIDYYGKVLRLGTTPFEGDPTYLMWTAGGVPIGGVMKLPDEAQAMGSPPHWLTYVSVTDVHATAAKVAELGGRTFVAPTDIPGGGSFGVFTDPQGAAFGVHARGDAPPPPDTTPALEFSWHELATTDWPAAWAFYQEVFGWEETDSMEMDPGNTYHMFGLDGESLGGMYNQSSEMPAPPHWLPYADVEDVEAIAMVVKELGGKVLNGPMDVPGGGQIAQCMDPQGAMFAAYQAPAKVTKTATPAAQARTVRKKTSAKAAKKTVVKKKAVKKVGRKKRR